MSTGTPAPPGGEQTANGVSHRALPKDMSVPMTDSYDPKQVESGWAEWWEKTGLFNVNAKSLVHTAEEQKFVMVIPPPNVTGSLHLGHTLTVAVEDTLTRWHRMCGRVSLWVPGVDHAGIATQSVVERKLLKTENLTRHDLGREAFLKKVWEWKEENGNRITYQLRRLGVSADWKREAFTMNPMLSKAVVEAFVRLFDRGLLYRDTRLVSWCPYLKTALSDIEVDPEDVDKPTRTRVPGFDKTVEVGYLWHFKYPLADDPSRFLEVATTRIETMLGDTAVAVHPEDKRYKDIVGKRLRHPFFPERDMRVIADAHVDPEFGTGAVKVTPAHDKNDYEIGKRHNLDFINIFTLDGRINENGGKFAGQHRFECRHFIQPELEKLGLLGEKKPNEKSMQLPRCSRSNDIIEYMLIPQWWMNCTDVAARAVKAVQDGELQILPSFHQATWYRWLENIRDWCVSRQLWWGHRIPAYKVVKPAQDGKEVWVAARDLEEAKEKAKKATGASEVEVEQDEDVLDTWFASGLFPFSVFGWPDETDDMKAFFPTSLLETGHDILFFWVARMVMMSLLLTDKLPFHTVYLHAMVRDAHGKKMSKSLGNVIDPIEVMEGITLDAMHAKLKEGNLPEKEVTRAADAQKKDFPKGIPECGADALRYGLLAYTKQCRDVNLDINRVVGYRYFCNKLWNAMKFALNHFPRGFSAHGVELSNRGITWTDRWMLHRLSICAKKANEGLHNFQFSDVVTATYDLWLYEFCDIYLELLKPRLTSDDHESAAAAREVLYTVLDWGLRLLHPMTPFITEELYHRLPPSPWKQDSICVAVYPLQVLAWMDHFADDEMAAMMATVRQFRSLFARLEMPVKERPRGYIVVKQTETTEGVRGAGVSFFSERLGDISTLAKIGKVEIINSTDDFPRGSVADVVSDRVTIALDPAGSVNLAAVVEKLQKKIGVAQKQIDGLTKKIEDPLYEKKVPQEVRTQNIEKVAALKEELGGLQAAKANIETAQKA